MSLYKKVFLLFLIAFLIACKEDKPYFNGYIDADLSYLSSNFPGRLEHLSISRGESVQANQLLFKLEKTNNNLDVAISEFAQKALLAQKEELINQIKYEDLNYQRIDKMRKADAASQNDLELAKKNSAVLNNQLAAIMFQIKSSQLNTADKEWQGTRMEGRASASGIVFDTYFTKEEYVQAGQPILSLITKDRIKVIFFVPEKMLGSLKLNQSVKLSTDDNPDYATARINYIAKIAQYNPPMIYSRQERINLVFRVEAKINNPDLNKIHLGLPVSLELLS